MASVYDLKPAFQRLLRPLCGRLAGWGVTANQVTVLSVVLSAAAGGAVVAAPEERWPLLLYPVVLFVRMALNAVDGMLAREFDQRSRLGAVLNELGDVVSDATLYLPLSLVPGVPAIPIVLGVILAGLTETAGVVAVQIGASRRYDGPMGKSDRAAVLGGVTLALGLGVRPDRWLEPVLWLVVGLLVVTVLQRSRRALGEGDA